MSNPMKLTTAQKRILRDLVAAPATAPPVPSPLRGVACAQAVQAIRQGGHVHGDRRWQESCRVAVSQTGQPGIDPGHGPGDGIMAGAVPEHVDAWGLCNAVDRIRGTGSLVCSRGPNSDPTNTERASLFRLAGCPFVISVHVNDGPPSYHGAHAFHREGSRLGRAVAVAIMQAWPAELSRRHLFGSWAGRTWVEGSVALPNRDYWPRVSSVFDAYQGTGVELVLVETRYATNRFEDATAQIPAVREEMALALARGFVVGERFKPA